ncbi:Nuclear pore complex protein [Abeliophyllum distichum]|uniref:Nuclear pore complex protein n=1 Tax=Abeliophyllum distichum TaxID=126358 RepID=A0ABD1VVW3_9LAMI
MYTSLISDAHLSLSLNPAPFSFSPAGNQRRSPELTHISISPALSLSLSVSSRIYAHRAAADPAGSARRSGWICRRSVRADLLRFFSFFFLFCFVVVHGNLLVVVVWRLAVAVVVFSFLLWFGGGVVVWRWCCGGRWCCPARSSLWFVVLLEVVLWWPVVVVCGLAVVLSGEEFVGGGGGGQIKARWLTTTTRRSRVEVVVAGVREWIGDNSHSHFYCIWSALLMTISPPEESVANNESVTIEVDEEIEGDSIGSRNYRFSRIGEPVPIKSEPDSGFDPECLPLQPLAVSERFRLLFVAHPDGFCVARTKEVIASAEEFKDKKTGRSVQELSFVDLPMGKVSILALSADDSVLAATVGRNIHFFAVSALLHKEQKPSFSVSLDDSSCIKDMRWSRKFKKVYVTLSTDGKLYHGSGQGPLDYMMDNVDSVDWSVKGNFVAVARKNVLSILSSQFKERLSLLLPFKSVGGDSDVNQVIKVDSIRWVRPDCIVVGCFLLNVDGKEENYLVQVITSKGSKLTDVSASSKPIVLSFENIFLDFRPDDVPVANGPNLFLSYLDLHGLAFIANRKNLSQHVVLLCWSLDHGKNEAAMIEILNDTWIPHIECQGDGEDNLILGLSVDKVSHNENVKFTLGEEETEVSPCCVLLCLRIDGKISVFHFASAIGASVSSKDLADSDEEDDASHVSLLNHEPAQISSKVKEESGEQTFSRLDSHELSRSRIDKRENERVTIIANPQPSSILANINLAKGFSKTEDKSISEVKSSTSSFSGKVLSLSNNQQTGSSMESLGKMASTNLQNTQPLTWSTGKVDSLKAFDERSLLLPSHDVEWGMSNKSDISASQFAGDPHRGAGPSVTLNSSGQRSSIGMGNIHALPAHRVSQVPMQGSFTLGKSLENQPNKENNATRSPTGSLYSEPNVSKQFSNVEEMANKLNNLLEGIEGKGGFKDASVASQEKAVMELEDGIWALSDRCSMWKGIMDKQHMEVQPLFDKTVQVLARKIYMEGIFKQATDSRYWDLWNRQKLSPELELKRRHILDLDQELTNQMIELERHFNALELNRFGENREMQTNRKALQSWRGQSRHIQELHSLHNTMSAQIAAAEQLSECLSKQMAVLKIESSAKEQDVKTKLFESIGLSYVGASHSSPSKERALDTLSNKKILTTSHSVSAKEQSTRHQANLAKGYEPETVRRRRDSLDRSWARFEPPKTTVKRMLLPEDGELSANRSLFTGDKQDLTPQFQKGPELARSALPNLSAASLFQTKNREDQSTECSSPYLAQRTAGLLDRGMQVLSTKTSGLTSQSVLESTATRDIEQGAHKLTDGKSSSSAFVGKNDIFAASEPKFALQSKTHLGQTPSITTKLGAQTPTTLNNSSEISVHNDKKLGPTKSTIGDENQMPAMTGSPLSELKFPFAPASTFGSGSNLSKPSAPASSPATPPNSKTSIDTIHKASQSQTLVSSFLNLPSALTFSIPEMSGISSISQPRLESPKSSSQPPMVMFGTKTDGISPTQTSIASLYSTIEERIVTQASASKVELSTPTYDSKLGPSVSSSTTEFPTKSKSGNQIDIGSMLNSSSDVASKIKLEEPNVAEVQLPTAVSTAGIVPAAKHVTSDASHEDEMEEEAPETDQTTDLALGNLGGFGLGSTPNSTAANLNPFGVAVLNRDATPAISTFTMPTPSGELFRPASFNFQSLQPSQALQPTNVGVFAGGFNTGSTSQVPPVSGFGQSVHIGSGQHVLGSVLGGFGQSRQLGAGLTGTSAASASGFGSGFMGVSSGGFGGGFAAASTGGGFARLASGGGGFAAAATGGGFAAAAPAGGGFAGTATAGTGFSGGGFGALGNQQSGGFGALGNQQGGGFGAFGNQQGGGSGFSAFGSSSGAERPPTELFTQMRR